MKQLRQQGCHDNAKVCSVIKSLINYIACTYKIIVNLSFSTFTGVDQWLRSTCCIKWTCTQSRTQQTQWWYACIGSPGNSELQKGNTVVSYGTYWPHPEG